MGKLTNLIAGLGGAVVLNILHETLKNKGRDMPRIDLLGEEALQKSLGYLNATIEDEKDLYLTTLAGDVVGNAIYYSMIGGRNSLIWPKAVILGLAAGIGAVKLPKPLGLEQEPTSRGTKTSVLTIAYYLSGAIVTGAILKSLR